MIKVHLRGTFATVRWAAEYWRNRAKQGQRNDARIINTTSATGLFGNVGQTNYGAAKAGIAALTIIAARELGRYGVTVNAINPGAHTRMTEQAKPGSYMCRSNPGAFDVSDPENIAPLVTWLASPESSHITGRVFSVRGGQIRRGGGVARRAVGWTRTAMGCRPSWARSSPISSSGPHPTQTSTADDTGADRLTEAAHRRAHTLPVQCSVSRSDLAERLSACRSSVHGEAPGPAPRRRSAGSRWYHRQWTRRGPGGRSARARRRRCRRRPRSWRRRRRSRRPGGREPGCRSPGTACT